MVPKLDNLIGISIYCTRTEGTGGKIRSLPDQFFVSEILRENTLSKISNSGIYTVYKLKKSGIDTNHALSEIFKRYGLRLKALGLKDANATTEQYVCDMSTGRGIGNIETNRYALEKIGFQRFGSRRPISHLIGKAILQKNFDYAIEVLLSTSSEYDLQENKKIRDMLKDKSNYSKMLTEVPPQMDIERLVLKEIIDHGDAKRALRAIHLPLRRFFVEAFKSYIFNRTISKAYEYREELLRPEEDDVCYDKDDNLGRYQNDPQQRLAIPLVGYSYSKKNRFNQDISQILDEEQVSPKDFFVKEMQEVSDEGGFRQAAIQCRDFSISEPYLSFTLSRGSYATILLREIIKPMDPITAGF
ncbi:MAG: tRNA pseudouridine(13) synthase TruD [Thaumarchaeota archaeon]|nr:MAG: tRNA pseudouridine(13) synthase TruD [Nitrososphaerota archaeon]